MPGKAKLQKHTKKEIAGKHKAAKEARGAAGGGGIMAEKRKNVGNKVAVKCEICMALQPNIQSMEAHYDSKHGKINFVEVKESYEKLFQESKNKA